MNLVLAHIAGVPVEETLLSVGPALVAAVSVGLVHIRSLRDRSPSADDDPLAGSAGRGGAASERGHPRPADPLAAFATAPVGGPGAPGRGDDGEQA